MYLTDIQKKTTRAGCRGGALLRLVGHVLARDDVIPTSCVLAAVALALQLVARASSHLLVGGATPLPAQLTGMASAVHVLRAEATAGAEDHARVDVAALDAWYRRHVSFEIASLAGALQYFADGKQYVHGVSHSFNTTRYGLLILTSGFFIDSISLPTPVTSSLSVD